MSILRGTVAIVLAILVAVPAAQAQSHVVSSSALDAAVQERLAADQADRDAILALLEREEVRQVAAQAAIPLDRAQAAVATLDGETLQELASQARVVHEHLAGGASAIVISTTTIIIVLLLIILIVLIAD